MAEKRRLHTTSGRFTWKKRKVDVNVCENATQTDYESLPWNEGRRIVELGFMAEQLKSCQKCKTRPLHLQDCVGEIRYGFGSMLKIKCACSHINKIYTGKQHRTESKSDRGLKIWDVNSKAALAMIHTGLGPKQVGSFFSTMNIPPISVKALKTRERDAGDDVRMLYDLLSVAGVTEEQLQNHSFLVSNVEDRKKIASQKKTILDTYNPFIREKIMSYQMCDKAAGTGLSFTHIKCAYNRSGQDGVSSIFSERTQSNKPRVTIQKKIIKRVCDFLARP